MVAETKTLIIKVPSKIWQQKTFIIFATGFINIIIRPSILCISDDSQEISNLVKQVVFPEKISNVIINQSMTPPLNCPVSGLLIQKAGSTNWGFLILYHYLLKQG